MSNQPPAAVRANWNYILPICLVATLGGLIFGYDTGVIAGAIEPLTAKFALTDIMKGWASGCVLIGCAVGRAGGRPALRPLRAQAGDVSGGADVSDLIDRHGLFPMTSGSSSSSVSSAAWASASPRSRRPCISPRSPRRTSAAAWWRSTRSPSSAAWPSSISAIMALPCAARNGPGLPRHAAALQQSLTTQFAPTELQPGHGTFTLACGSADGVQAGMGCSLGLLVDAQKPKPIRVALATIDSVTEHQCRGTLIPAALPNINWAVLTATPATGYPKPVVTLLSASESWNIHTGWRWMFLSGHFLRWFSPCCCFSFRRARAG